MGPRIWVDLPGAPQLETLAGNGAILEVRGRPTSATRLVIEFKPGTRLDPRQIQWAPTSTAGPWTQCSRAACHR